MSRTISLVFVAVACCALVSPARAQQADSVRASAVARLPQGRHILVLTSAGEGVEGRLAAVRGGSLILEPRDESPARTIPLANIDTVWTAGNNAGKGFLIGAIIGGLVGGVGVAAVGQGLSQGTGDGCNCGGKIAGATIGSAVFGGLLGALLGAMNTSWHRVAPQ